MRKLLIIKLLFIFLIIPINSFEKYVDFDLIKKDGPPRFIENGVLFTLPETNGTVAFLRTNIDNWQKDYYFKSSLYNVLYAFVPYSTDIKIIKYKININGYWTSDPNNPEYYPDDLGINLSIIETPDEDMYYEEMPIIEETKNIVKKITFRYYNPYAKEVNFVCSIDNWNHYSHTMKSFNNGYWEIIKYYTPGTYLYYFLVDGEKKIDVDNPNKYMDEKRGQVSYFVIE